MAHAGISLPAKAIEQVCRRYRVRELSIFGSALRDDFRNESDVDFLVQFQPEARIGFLAFAGLQEDLSKIVGRTVDLVPKDGLKEVIRDEVLASAEVVYAA